MQVSCRSQPPLHTPAAKVRLTTTKHTLHRRKHTEEKFERISAWIKMAAWMQEAQVIHPVSHASPVKFGRTCESTEAAP